MRVVTAVNLEELENYISGMEDIENIEIVRNKKKILDVCQERQPDVIIISHTLAGEDDIKPIIIKLTSKDYKNIRIIYIYGEDDSERKEFINFLITRGIYDYHVGIEIRPEDINNLFYEPKARNDVKKDVINNIESIEKVIEEKEKPNEVENKINDEIKIIEKEIITEKIKGTIFISFAGADSNIGCTHAAYLTAYYLSQQGYKTAYLEMCEDPIFYKGYKDDPTVKEIEGGYAVEKNLNLYVKYLNGNVEYGKAVSNGYTYIVIDLGCIFQKDKKGNIEATESIREMERATVSILVGGGSKWQYDNIVEAAKFGHDNWKLYINFADKDNEKAIITTIQKITGKEVYLAPYTPNCFKQYSEQEEFLELILKDVLPKKIIKKPSMVSKLFSKKKNGR